MRVATRRAFVFLAAALLAPGGELPAGSAERAFDFADLLRLFGALGLTVFRFAGWHSYGHEDAATIFEEDKWTPVPPEEK